jgi:hypothetical protein
MNEEKNSCERHSENWNQEMLFKWANGELKNGRDELRLLGAIPNGGRQIRWKTILNYKHLGFRAGMPDIYFLIARGGYNGMFIELKSQNQNARLNKGQRMMHQLLRDVGYRVEVCRGYQSAIRAINEYAEFDDESVL